MVFLATSVMRTVARTELPSTKAAITCARFLVLNLFTVTIIQAVTHKVKYKMINTELPYDFDWVTTRLNCSLSGFFERLQVLSRANVDTRNASLDSHEREDGCFKVESHGSKFSVLRDKKPGRSVRFWTEGESLHVEGATQSGDVSFSGMLTLGNDARCRLLVCHEQLAEWQVLRKALEPLFFPA